MPLRIGPGREAGKPRQLALTVVVQILLVDDESRGVDQIAEQRRALHHVPLGPAELPVEGPRVERVHARREDGPRGARAALVALAVDLVNLALIYTEEYYRRPPPAVRTETSGDAPRVESAITRRRATGARGRAAPTARWPWRGCAAAAA